MEDARNRKVNPYQFTIQFSKVIPKHRTAAKFLNECGRAKSQIIADALELYFEKYGYPDETLPEGKQETHRKKKMTDIPSEESIGVEPVLKQEIHPKSTNIQPIQDIQPIQNVLIAQPMEDIPDKPSDAVTDVSENEKQTDIKLHKETNREKELTEYEEETPETEGDISDLDADLLIQSLMGFDSSDG